MSGSPWPVQLRLIRAEKRLDIEFDDGKKFSLPAEDLRHDPSHKITVPGRIHVGIMELEPVGNYAVRIKFDDLHDTGIFSWDYLYQLGTEQPLRWRNYLQALKDKGLSREPGR